MIERSRGGAKPYAPAAQQVQACSNRTMAAGKTEQSSMQALASVAHFDESNDPNSI
ncbi:hypothetical protein CBOM_02103 [Ceraceosorus bombacis]|uniref:Uncharacterized protein n=1 Tax=Ceraceosorus bombacis TaxID=401625 RepID=A0A0P1BE29_9BASI|nr:hypothetical protein CBOM_02103 [Ceraceosorus bombacis]